MLWTAFILGLGGSLHCVGMCGPIVLALPVYKGQYKRLLWSRMLYNIGRLITYSLMGGVLGVIGYGLALAGFQQVFSIVLGLLILLMMIFPKITNLLNASHPINQLNHQVKSFFGKLLKKRSLSSQFFIGMANGLLPCGLVYVALAGAIIAGTFSSGALYMALFGLGTFPLMLAFSFSGNYIGLQFKRRLYKFMPVFVSAIAIIFILRGLNLGIPYLSPKVNHQSTEVEMCH